MTEKMIKARVLVDSVIWLPIQKAIESVGLTLDDIIEDKAIKNHFTDLCFAVAYNKLRKETQYEGDRMMWGKARKKPIVVAFREPVTSKDTPTYEMFHTKRGKSIAHPGKDYILEDPSGEIYAIKIDVFHETYDVLEPIQSSAPTVKKVKT